MDGLTLQLVLSVIQTATLVGALAFGVIEIRQAARLRRDQQAIEQVRSIQLSEWWMRSVLQVMNLPEGIGAEGVDARGEETLKAAMAISLMCETTGYMVFRRVVPLRVVDDLHGGFVRLAWERLRPWVERDRERSGNVNSFEWFQWLAERLAEHPDPAKGRGAHVSHRLWRP
jgi:hypothetical protein